VVAALRREQRWKDWFMAAMRDADGGRVVEREKEIRVRVLVERERVMRWRVLFGDLS